MDGKTNCRTLLFQPEKRTDLREVIIMMMMVIIITIITMSADIIFYAMTLFSSSYIMCHLKNWHVAG